MSCGAAGLSGALESDPPSRSSHDSYSEPESAALPRERERERVRGRREPDSMDMSSEVCPDFCPWEREGEWDSSRLVFVERGEWGRPWRPLSGPLVFLAAKKVPIRGVPLELLLLRLGAVGVTGTGRAVAAAEVAGARCVAFHFLTAAS